nr:MAG TPA: hypothetical protein [Caudoviricetes sp.]
MRCRKQILTKSVAQVHVYLPKGTLVLCKDAKCLKTCCNLEFFLSVNFLK